MEILDLLLSRYNSPEYVLNLPWDQGIEIITKALEKQAEQMIWQMWLSLYPNMEGKTSVSFSEFKERILQSKSKTSSKTTAELIAEAEKIKALDQKGVEQVGDI